MHSFRRREVITFLGSAAAWPLAARAQQALIPVIGVLRPDSPGAGAKAVAAFTKRRRGSGR
jgi:putative ABC transport system substrate-binding protein